MSHACACRRAYCAYGDVLIPPAWLALAAYLSSLPGLPMWALLLAVMASGVGIVGVMGVILQ